MTQSSVPPSDPSSASPLIRRTCQKPSRNWQCPKRCGLKCCRSETIAYEFVPPARIATDVPRDAQPRRLPTAVHARTARERRFRAPRNDHLSLLDHKYPRTFFIRLKRSLDQVMGPMRGGPSFRGSPPLMRGGPAFRGSPPMMRGGHQ